MLTTPYSHCDWREDSDGMWHPDCRADIVSSSVPSGYCPYCGTKVTVGARIRRGSRREAFLRHAIACGEMEIPRCR